MNPAILPQTHFSTLPEPLRAAEIPSFANYSVVVRLPEIGQRVLADNDFPPDIANRVEAFINAIPHERVRPVSGVPEEYGWEKYIQPYLGMDWLSIPWFFAEEYFYLRMLEACSYFTSGPGFRQDPYILQKRLGLESTRKSIIRLARQGRQALERYPSDWRDSLTRLLLADLWGNQNDLSMWPVEKNGNDHTFSGGSSAPGSSRADPHGDLAAVRAQVLVDNTGPLLDTLETFSARDSRIDIILDNAGYELVTDLALADFLLGAGLAAEVVLHTKCYPVFVSDALEQDIYDTMDWLSISEDREVSAMATRLRFRLSGGKLRVDKHPFWTSPLAAWEMPTDLVEEINSSNLLIWKGDANYRRLLGDRHWPIDTPFTSVVGYFQPAVLALRTCKSEIAIGLAPERVPTGDETWLYNGKWGLIQLAPCRS